MMVGDVSLGAGVGDHVARYPTMEGMSPYRKAL